MKQIFVIFSLMMMAVATQAAQDIYSYDYWAPFYIKDYLSQVDQNSPAEGAPECSSMYQPMIKKGVLDVRYALGYFDDTTGEERVWNSINYGLSPSLDIPVFNAIRQQLTTACPTRSLRLCGFSESGDPSTGKVVLQKYVTIQGSKTLVRITLTQASASESFAQNKGPLASRQAFLTQQSEENFFGGLETADVVFYNGHSRNGGGPDFNPPILNSLKKVDYHGYYQIKKPGILRTLAELKKNPNPGFVLALFSCFSRLHFYNDFMKANPQQRLILSADTIDYFDSLKGSMGYLEGILRGSCGQALADTAKQNDKIRTGFQGYQLH